jgi:mono/diheme cytochrome c family protein
MRAIKHLTMLAFIFAALNLSTFGQDAADKQAPRNRTTVWNGVFSPDQATQGQTIFSARCSRCHGNDLSGGAVGTSLIGNRFMQFWSEGTVASLFTTIRDTMPRNAGGTLTEEEYVHVTAFILQRNGFPAGSSELKPAAMSEIHIEAKEGPKPLPNNAMIQVIGCMTPDGDAWTLTKATSPVRTRTPNVISPEERKAAQNTPLGTATFRLQNLVLLGSFQPEAHKGHTMLAKGPLLRRSNGEMISVTALEMVGEGCGQ